VLVLVVVSLVVRRDFLSVAVVLEVLSCDLGVVLARDLRFRRGGLLSEPLLSGAGCCLTLATSYLPPAI